MRVIYFPHGDGRVAGIVIGMLFGYFKQLPELGNLVRVGGNLVLNPNLPLIPLEEAKADGRKLRETWQQADQLRLQASSLTPDSLPNSHKLAPAVLELCRAELAPEGATINKSEVPTGAPTHENVSA